MVDISDRPPVGDVFRCESEEMLFFDSDSSGFTGQPASDADSELANGNVISNLGSSKRTNSRL